MVYNSIEEIEAAHPEPVGETPEQKTKRMKTINQAIRRLQSRQQKASQTAASSSTATTQIQTQTTGVEQSTSTRRRTMTTQPQQETEEESEEDLPSRKRTKTTHPQTETGTEEEETTQPTSLITRTQTTASATSRKRKSRAAQATPSQTETEEEPEQGTSSRKKSKTTSSKTTASATLRKQKSRAEQTERQRQREKKQDRIRAQVRYAKRREQLREQFLNIGHCTIDDYSENRIDEDTVEDGRHKFGNMDNVCRQCFALKWEHETKGFCCQNEQVTLSQLNPAPQPLLDLLTSTDVKNTRKYNFILAFTSLKAEIDKELASAKSGVYTFQLQGALYHQIGELEPRVNRNTPKFAQIYFHDTDLDKQLQIRSSFMTDLNPETLKNLQLMLYQINPFVKVYMTVGEKYRDDNPPTIKLYIHNTHGKDMRQYNQQTASEVAAIILDDEEKPNNRDIVVKRKQGQLVYMTELHGTYDPLQYPLLFPYGEYGWHEHILRANEEDSDTMDVDDDDDGKPSQHTGATQAMQDLLLGSSRTSSKGKGKAIETEPEPEKDDDEEPESDKDDNDTEERQISKKRKWVSIREFAVYRIQIRNSIKTTSTLHLSGRLFQQYLVDQFAKWESNQLRWHRNHQQELRYETVRGIKDIISYQDADLNRIGNKRSEEH